MSWPWIALLEIAWICACTVWILTERRAPTATIAWIVTLSFLPLLGIPIYFLIGPRRLRRRRNRYVGLSRRVAESLRRFDGEGKEAPDVLRQMKLAVRLDE